MLQLCTTYTKTLNGIAKSWKNCHSLPKK